MFRPYDLVVLAVRGCERPGDEERAPITPELVGKAVSLLRELQGLGVQPPTYTSPDPVQDSILLTWGSGGGAVMVNVSPDWVVVCEGFGDAGEAAEALAGVLGRGGAE